MTTEVATSNAVVAVSMQGISKRFPGIIANQAVDFTVQAGEIHALLGENGAGKTTLMNLLCGLYEPDAGEIYLFGERVRFRSARDAIAAGIGMVHQHFMLVENFTVADNIVLGQGDRPFLRESPKRLHQRLRTLANQYGLNVDPAALVWQLSVGQQQRVEILKALYRRAQVLILDEPTAVLTPAEATELLTTLRQLAQQGTAIVLITHKLNEVMAASDRVTVLRDGQTVGTLNTADCTEQALAKLMVGREVSQQRPEAERHNRSATTTPALQLQHLWVIGNHQRPALRGVDLAVYPGEIVGIAGVDGNGQRELEEVISGLRSPHEGDIQLTGKLAHIPSDRYAMGLLTEFSIADNLALKDIDQPPFCWRGVLRPAAIRQAAIARIAQFLIRTPSVNTPAGKLSGGNAQKVIFARELSRDHRVLLAAQPTRGLDIGATEFVHAQLRARRDAGVAIVLISTELEEILNLSDRIAVLYEGAIVGWMDGNTADIHHLGLLMAGKQQAATDHSP